MPALQQSIPYSQWDPVIQPGSRDYKILGPESWDLEN